MNVKYSFFVLLFFVSSVFADLNWFSRIYLSNKSYAKNMMIESYLVDSSQLADFFYCQDSFLQQKKRGDLNDTREPLFLVVKCKNAGACYALGELIFNIKGLNLSIPIACAGLHGNMESFSNIAVIYIGSLYLTGDDELPKITYKWRHVYAL